MRGQLPGGQQCVPGHFSGPLRGVENFLLCGGFALQTPLGPSWNWVSQAYQLLKKIINFGVFLINHGAVVPKLELIYSYLSY